MLRVGDVVRVKGGKRWTNSGKVGTVVEVGRGGVYLSFLNDPCRYWYFDGEVERV